MAREQSELQSGVEHDFIPSLKISTVYNISFYFVDKMRAKIKKNYSQIKSGTLLSEIVENRTYKICLEIMRQLKILI